MTMEPGIHRYLMAVRKELVTLPEYIESVAKKLTLPHVRNHGGYLYTSDPKLIEKQRAEVARKQRR
jgi:hypothetical protein